MKLRAPLSDRHGIPIYCEKSPNEYRKDPYERYDPMVIRQSRLHLANLETGTYPMQPILDLALKYIDAEECANVCEVGCGVGRLIGEIAQSYPTSDCYGIDYSYQMLRQAQRYWVQGQQLELGDNFLGYDSTNISPRSALANLSFHMADAHRLPFIDTCMDLLVSTFTIDRLQDPAAAIYEWCRVLQAGGVMIIATPLNWQSAKGWQKIPDGEALTATLTKVGLHILDHQQLLIQEPIDARGNFVGWQTEVVVASKK